MDSSCAHRKQCDQLIFNTSWLYLPHYFYEYIVPNNTFGSLSFFLSQLFIVHRSRFDDILHRDEKAAANLLPEYDTRAFKSIKAGSIKL